MPTAGVTLVATLLAAGVGLRPAQVVLLAVAVLSGQLSIGWSNDVIDARRDAAAARSDKPVAAGALARRTVAAAAATALAMTAGLSFALGVPAGVALLTLVAAGWAYNVGLKATVLSGAVYLVGFAALPVAPYLVRDGVWPAWWVPVSGGLFGLAAHFANVLPDLAADAQAGVRGLPQRLGARGAVIAMAATLAAASVVLGVAPPRESVAVGASAAAAGCLGALCAGVVAARRPGSAAAFRITLGIAVLDVVLVIGIAT